MRRPLGADPDPLVVAVSEADWRHLARFADIVLAEADRMADVLRLCDELFGDYPGLTLAGFILPDRTVVIIRRRGRAAVWAAVHAERMARAVYSCG